MSITTQFQYFLKKMLKLILLLEVLAASSSYGETVVDYATDNNRYNTYPYYQHNNNPIIEPMNPSELGQVPLVQESSVHPIEPPVSERFGNFFPPIGQFGGGGYGGGLPPPPPSGGYYGGGDGSQEYNSAGGYNPSPYGPAPFGPAPYGPSNQPPPYGYPDPGFQTQTGFEGLLVPNSWYGLLPWGIEGVIIVIAGIIVFAIIVIAIIGLLGWLCGVKKVLPWLTKSDEEAEIRSIFGDQWNMESFMNLSANVIDAIEKFNEISEEKINKKII